MWLSSEILEKVRQAALDIYLYTHHAVTEEEILDALGIRDDSSLMGNP